jgi:hypothetical protein
LNRGVSVAGVAAREGRTAKRPGVELFLKSKTSLRHDSAKPEKLLRALGVTIWIAG